KHNIYPEYVPSTLPPVRPSSRYEQFLDHLRQHSDLTFVDLRQPLLQAKAREQVYERLDSHWNDCGAYVGYHQLVSVLGTWFGGMRPLPRSAFDTVTCLNRWPDLTCLMGLDGLMPEESLCLQPRTPRRARPADHRVDLTAVRCPDHEKPLATECDGCGA